VTIPIAVIIAYYLKRYTNTPNSFRTPGCTTAYGVSDPLLVWQGGAECVGKPS
jgi:hypothetical protein